MHIFNRLFRLQKQVRKDKGFFFVLKIRSAISNSRYYSCLEMNAGVSRMHSMQIGKYICPTKSLKQRGILSIWGKRCPFIRETQNSVKQIAGVGGKYKGA